MKTTVPTAFTLLRVDPETPLARVRSVCEEYTFADPASPQQEAWGFAPYPDQTEPVGAVGEYLRFGLRCDRRTVPPKLLKARVAEEMARWNEENPGRERVPAKVRVEIKDAVAAELLRLTLPVPTVYSVVVNPAAGWAIVGATASGVVDRIRRELARIYGGEGVGTVSLLEMQHSGAALAPRAFEDEPVHGGFLAWLWYCAANGRAFTDPHNDQQIVTALGGPASVGGLRTKEAGDLLPRCLVFDAGGEIEVTPVASLRIVMHDGDPAFPVAVTLDGAGFKSVQFPTCADADADEAERFVGDMLEIENLLRRVRSLAQGYRALSEGPDRAAIWRAFKTWATGQEALDGIDRITAAQIQAVVETVQNPDSEAALALHERLRSFGYDGLQARLCPVPERVPVMVRPINTRERVEQKTAVLRAEAPNLSGFYGRVQSAKEGIDRLREDDAKPDALEEWAETIGTMYRDVVVRGGLPTVQDEAVLSGIESALEGWGAL